MDDFNKIIIVFQYNRMKRIRERRSSSMKMRTLIIKSWLENIIHLIKSYQNALRLYTPRFKPNGSHYRSTVIGKNLLSTLNDDRFSKEFRISQKSFSKLCSILKEYLEPKWNALSQDKQKRCTVEEKVAIAIYKLKSCAEYQAIGNLFGYSKPTVHRIFHQVVEAIVKHLTKEYIKMPTEEEAKLISTEFNKICGIPQVIGAIDCTHIPITAPMEGSKDFLNRKGFTSINMQAVVDHNLMFRNISCKFPGNVHDATVLRGSVLYNCQEDIFPKSTYILEGVHIPYMLLGDPAYPLLPWIMKDYPGTNLDHTKQNLNVHLNKGRVKVEQTFGILKSCWRILSRRSDINVDFMPKVVLCCCVLHNMLRSERNIMLFKTNDNDSDTEATDNFEFESIDRRNNMANVIRDTIAKNII